MKKEKFDDFLERITPMKIEKFNELEKTDFFNFLNGEDVGMVKLENSGLTQCEMKTIKAIQKHDKIYLYSFDNVLKLLKRVYEEKKDFEKIKDLLSDCNGKREKKYCFNSEIEVFEKKLQVFKKVKNLKVKKSSLEGIFVKVKSNYEDFPKSYKYAVNLNLVTFTYKKGFLVTEKIEIGHQGDKAGIIMSEEVKKELMENLYREKIEEIY